MRKTGLVLILLLTIIGCSPDAPNISVKVSAPSRGTALANTSRVTFDRYESSDLFDFMGKEDMMNSPHNTLDAENVVLYKLKDKQNGNIVYVINSGDGVGISAVKP